MKSWVRPRSLVLRSEDRVLSTPGAVGGSIQKASVGVEGSFGQRVLCVALESHSIWGRDDRERVEDI